ncbi:MAG: hypothetical protein ACI8Y4_002362 [Candidatus Poriferisodalaceae bacterium]|jgi:hypothetical protein
MGSRRKPWIALVLAFGLFGASCGDSDDAMEPSVSEAGEGSDDAAQNACPADGCQINFGTIEKSGDELEITWDLNFDPDINSNHIHIYWDNFSAAQVSNDATERNVIQGDWVPTDLSPVYVTDGPASTSVRGDSTTLCLVAADRDHNVIDEGVEICKDVSEFL